MNELIAKELHKIVKANVLVREGKYSLTLQEQRIVLYLIQKIKPNDTEFKECVIDLKYFCDMFGISTNSGKSYVNLKKTIQSLASKTFWVQMENVDKTEKLMYWIKKAEIVHGKNIVKLKLDDDLKPYLIAMKSDFTAYEMVHIIDMDSSYAIRLYEILKSYEFLVDFTLEFEKLIKLLDRENTYKKWADFKRRVLDVSINQINARSDITVTYTPVKQGRYITSARFTIKPKLEYIKQDNWEDRDFY